MVGYKGHRAVNPWIVGLVVFILAMAITFADVYGLNQFDVRKPAQNGSNGTQTQTDPGFYDSNTNDDSFPNQPLPTDDPSPNRAIPEPATLTLLGLGLGAMLLRKRGK